MWMYLLYTLAVFGGLCLLFLVFVGYIIVFHADDLIKEFFKQLTGG